MITAVPAAPWTALLLGHWVAPTGEEHAVARAAAHAWQAVGRPTGLLAHTILTDDRNVWHLSFASDNSTFARVARVKGPWNDLVDTAVPGVQRLGVQMFHRHRSVDGPAAGDPAGCIVLVHLHGPDRLTATAWIDQLASAAAHRPGPNGLITAHFHVADDGHILNVAEWTSERHHQQTLPTRDPDDPVVQVVDATPGVHFDTWDRFTTWTTVTQH